MITISGQLAIETRHGRYGDFNVGQLRTSIGQFAVKDPDLDQYPQGKYEGDFDIVEIRPQTYPTNGRIVFEMRAYLGGIRLSNIDELTNDDAQKLAPQEPDPIEQEPKAPVAETSPQEAMPAALPIVAGDEVEQAPAPVASPPVEAASQEPANDEADVQLFGPLWPLSVRFKLDTTIDRRLIRQQCARLDELDYDFDPRTQEWYREAA
jgi:hypothetical protein